MHCRQNPPSITSRIIDFRIYKVLIYIFSVIIPLIIKIFCHWAENLICWTLTYSIYFVYVLCCGQEIHRECMWFCMRCGLRSWFESWFFSRAWNDSKIKSPNKYSYSLKVDCIYSFIYFVYAHCPPGSDLMSGFFPIFYYVYPIYFITFLTCRWTLFNTCVYVYWALGLLGYFVSNANHCLDRLWQRQYRSNRYANKGTCKSMS